MIRPFPALLLSGVLSGCTLVDQNTFYADASTAPAIPQPPAPTATAPMPAGPPPLLLISPGARSADYAEPLRKAVASARARKSGVVFDVVEMQPPNAVADADATFGAEATEVARAIVAAGVPPVQVRLDARPDAAAPPRQVRVYVR